MNFMPCDLAWVEEEEKQNPLKKNIEFLALSMLDFICLACSLVHTVV